MAIKKIKVGVVGGGYISEQVHLPVLAKSPDIEVLSVCDKDENKLQKMAKNFKVKKAYTQLGEMLKKEELNLIDICTPPDTHAVLAIQAMESGVNCIVEKPMTLKTKDADRMIATAKKQNLNLFVIHNYSYMPCIRKAKELVNNGEIGSLISVEVKYLCSTENERHCDVSHWCHNYPGDILSTEITPHLVMLILDFIGSEAAECVSVYQDKLSSNPHVKADELKAVIKGSGRIGALSLSYNSPYKHLGIYLIGTKGYMYTDVNSQAIIRHHANNFDNKAAFARGLESLSEIRQLSSGLMGTSMNVLLGRYSPMIEGHKYLMSKCCDQLLGRGEYPVSLTQSRQVVKILGQFFK